MPWKEVSIMSQREQFYNLWKYGKQSVSELCRIFGISRKTGYKWIHRGEGGGENCFEDMSKRPHHSPSETPAKLVEKILRLRESHPCWGGRKLKRVLENRGNQSIPSASTITEILRRNGKLSKTTQSSKKRIRFEHEAPNSLWQMDFKGHFSTAKGRCHALTVLDDHSRFNLVLKACRRETTEEVKSALIPAFKTYGLPDSMTMDNGSPWGNRCVTRHTKLTLWLVDLGIQVHHSTPYNPQTQGKDERFHLTLKRELLEAQYFVNFYQCQNAFDQWREVYNCIRPHEALALEVPANRYKVSGRSYQEIVEPYSYYDNDQIRLADCTGEISFKNRRFKLGYAFSGKRVAIRKTICPTKFDIYYRHQFVGKMDINEIPIKKSR